MLSWHSISMKREMGGLCFTGGIRCYECTQIPAYPLPMTDNFAGKYSYSCST